MNYLQACCHYIIHGINEKRNCEYIFCLAKRLKFFGGFELIFYKGLENQSEPKMLNKEIENLNNNQKNSFLYCCTVTDKFGDMGIVGFFYLLVKNRKAVLKDLILSCRAFGREIENSMIFKVKEILIFKKVNSFKIEFIKTKKNKPCYDFLNNNFKKMKKNIFYCSDLKQIKKPLYLRIK